MADALDNPVSALRELLRRSECIKAFDLARSGVARDPQSLPLRHGGVLALARMGAIEQARRMYAEWGLDSVTDDEDVLALKGRLLKDEALQLDGEERRRGLHAAAAAYRRAFEASGGYFSAINVASLSHLAGDHMAAGRWADEASRLAAGEVSYYGRATMAEAAILLGDLPAARQHLQEAVARDGASLDAKATTRRQLRMLLANEDASQRILKPLEPPAVAHFCGHRLSPEEPGARFPPSRETEVAAEVSRLIDGHDIRFAVGSLASGADIIV
ncbi:TRAFs-binding domain-containing protein, partial [Sneathiella sp.]|uniref:TRAFs-binding domain-containing protein n=1 Tax=Sneathiella sp. TaxID=1964365 RepID=UPI00356316D8